MKQPYITEVFINAPFDEEYETFLEIIAFTILQCGFTPRCAKEAYDSGEVRLNKIANIIKQCRYGIHDLSRTELDINGLPRFNMPFELGLFLGARLYGSGQQKQKGCLILDRDKHRYQKFISDISGQDISAHSESPTELVKIIRDWLAHQTQDGLPGSEFIYDRYGEFRQDLPKMCAKHHRAPQDLIYIEYVRLARAWIDEYRRLLQKSFS
jgi:hypothetical protein